MPETSVLHVDGGFPLSLAHKLLHLRIECVVEGYVHAATARS